MFAGNISGVSININIEYIDGGEGMTKEDLKAGENLMSIDGLHNPDPNNQRSQVYPLGGDREITEKKGGIYKVVGKDYNVAGNTGDMRGGSSKGRGFTLVHETFHFLGLSDRYDQKTMKAFTNFENDIMGHSGARTSQTHFNNWKNYLTQPQVQQQVNQSSSQFILRYKVDVAGQGRSKKLIN